MRIRPCLHRVHRVARDDDYYQVVATLQVYRIAKLDEFVGADIAECERHEYQEHGCTAMLGQREQAAVLVCQGKRRGNEAVERVGHLERPFSTSCVAHQPSPKTNVEVLCRPASDAASPTSRGPT